MLLYVEDCLAISETPNKAVLQLDKFFKMQPNSIAPPDIYLGGKVKKMRLLYMVEAWTFSLIQYVQEAVSNVDKFLQYLDGYMFYTNINPPLSNDYRPAMDSSPELYGADGAYYQSLLGILWWMVELGRIDICCEVSMMSSQLALPREGHLDQFFHIFVYLNKHYNSSLLFDLSYPDVNIDTSPKHDWTKFYGDVKEDMPPDMP